MGTANQGKDPGDWLKWEQEGRYSRETIVILAGSGAARNLTSGMVLGKVTKGAGAAAAQASPVNTGDGTVGTITVGAAAKPGVYRVTFIEPATDLGRFTVEDPDGINVGTGIVGTAFSGGGLTFTISDGSADFVSGDAFLITVAAGSGKWVQYDENGTNGSEDAAGILYDDASAADGADGAGVAIVRDAIVSANGIVWPATADANEKAAAVAQLEALGIRVREGA